MSECDIFGHWIVDDNPRCVKCEKIIDLEDDSYVSIGILFKTSLFN